MDRLKEYFEKNRTALLEDFFTFLKFPSISSEPAFKEDVLNCAEWLLKKAEKIGLKTSLWKTEGHPIIFAEDLKAGPNQPTLLIYNHYDVQPTDPLDLWNHPPFEPTVVDGQIYARGAQDNKGQCFYVLKALEAYKELNGSFPINIKWLIEGEEEMGSVHLSKEIYKRKNELSADYLVVVDVGIPSMKNPCITLGVRGILTMDISVSCAKGDLHSGIEGGVAPNPIHILADLISKAHNDDGSVSIPGFYDGIVPLTDSEKRLLSFSFDENEYIRTRGVAPIGGEKGISALERAWTRPTLEVNGIFGGYTKEGFKTVLPANAHAKVSCRLVLGQDPVKVAEAVKYYFENSGPYGIEVKVDMHPSIGGAERVSPDTALIKAIAKAYEESFSLPCSFVLDGGSIPISSELARVSGATLAFIGLGLSTDQIHAPNEHFGIDRIEKGFYIISKMVSNLKK